MAGQAVAVQPDEVLPDPVLEERARDISAGLRCIVCRNESIDESNAELARDLRLLVRERLVAGDSDAGGRVLHVWTGTANTSSPPADDRLDDRALACRAGAAASRAGLSLVYVRRRATAAAPTEAELSDGKRNG
jgi:cytochrome c-type biogenesis protein CcmH